MEEINESYRTIYDYGEDEYTINKSRFIGYAKPIDTEEEALEFIEEISTKHHDATHNVYAYVLGLNSNVQRFSDDGEPSGTAGIPALEVLKKEGLRNTVVVVTRYYGGVKLGGGGLIRAYTKGAKIAVDAAEIIDMDLHTELEFEVDYDLYGKLENYLMSNNYQANDIGFLENVKINLHVKNSDLAKFKKDITDMSSGDVEIDELSQSHLPTSKGRRLPIKNK